MFLYLILILYIFLTYYDEDNYNQLLEKITNINYKDIININYNDILIKKVLYYFELIKILGKLKTIIYFNSYDHIDIFIIIINIILIV
jgi:hypothetical protein